MSDNYTGQTSFADMFEYYCNRNVTNEREYNEREMLRWVNHQLQQAQAELASYKAGVEVDGYVTGVPTDINTDLYFASGWSRELNAFSNKRVRLLVIRGGE